MLRAAVLTLAFGDDPMFDADALARQPVGPPGDVAGSIDARKAGLEILTLEGDDALGRPRQIGHDKADPRIKFTRMPLDLRHDTPRLLQLCA